MEKLKNIPHIEIILLALAAVVTVFPFLAFGMPYEIMLGSNDLIHHIQLTNSHIESFRQGSLIPDWTATDNFGYGSAAVRFYPPLAQMTLAAFYLISGNSWQTAFVLTFFLWSFVGGIGAYLWANDVLKNRFQAVVAGVLFTLAPYHLKQIHLTFMFGEFVAMSVLPFCFLFARRICVGGNMRNVAGFSVAFAVLILSNLPQLVIVGLCVGVYVLFYLEREKFLKVVGKFALASTLAFSATAFYWQRVFCEREWLNIYLPNTDPHYYFGNNFLLTVFHFDEFGIWVITLIFVLTILYFFASAAITGKLREFIKNADLRKMSSVFLFALFLSVPASHFIWTNFEFLQRVQFPWRFMTVMTAIVCILSASCFSFINGENLKNKRPIILLLIGFTLIFLTFSIKHISWGGQNITPAEFAAKADDGHNVKGIWHWLPVWVKDGVTNEKEKVIAGNRAIEIKSWDGERREFTIAEGDAAQVRIAVFYYPHWQVFINGKQIETRPSQNGALIFDAPTENSEVVLQFVEPFASKAAEIICVSAWGLIFGIFIYSWRRK